MVEFNGAHLCDISEKLQVLEVEVCAPKINLSSLTPAIANGEIFTRRSYGARPVNVHFVVLEERTEERTKILQDVARWAYSTQEKRLLVPQEREGYLMAVCSQLPNDKGREWWEKLTLSFKANDPYFQAFDESSADVGAAFSVLKDDGPNWRIEQNIEQALSLPSWEYGEKQISFSVLSPGHLELNSRQQTATTDGGSVLPSMLLGSRFFELSHGRNTIEAQNGAGGTIHWRERWI